MLSNTFKRRNFGINSINHILFCEILLEILSSFDRMLLNSHFHSENYFSSKAEKSFVATVGVKRAHFILFSPDISFLNDNDKELLKQLRNYLEKC